MLAFLLRSSLPRAVSSSLLLRAGFHITCRRGYSTELFPKNTRFSWRHIGPSKEEVQAMVKDIGLNSLDEVVQKAIPASIRLQKELDVEPELGEHELLNLLKDMAAENQAWRSYIGLGYYNCYTPTTIQRNILENPGWTTQYTPYQAEISQGRLESLLNFQTMVCDLTGMENANASLLDEATAAAEAMALCHRYNKKKVFIVDTKCHPQTIAVLQGRANLPGLQVQVREVTASTDFKDACGVLVQSPDTDGQVRTDLQELATAARQKKSVLCVASDLLSLTLLTPPGELGADVVLGSSQRFGVQPGYGGPAAAFFAVRKEFVRLMPGRMVGVAKDCQGKAAYRLALQTREQHIRRDKATSNVCTAQALLANMAAMFGVYHGPKGLRDIATRVHNYTRVIAAGASSSGWQLQNSSGLFFDTLRLRSTPAALEAAEQRAMAARINLRYYDDRQSLSLALDETVSQKDVSDLLQVLGCEQSFEQLAKNLPAQGGIFGSDMQRQSAFMQHPVFNSHQSETQMVRYMKRLENKDLSLVHSMIPLGSCTMKLNSTTEMMPVSWPEFAHVHPFAPQWQAQGYQMMFSQLRKQLAAITGFDAVSLQPNSGAQGEYAGLRAIVQYLRSIGQGHRNICLIPVSAHGTNPASAIMAGMKVQPVSVTRAGSIDMRHLMQLTETLGDKIGAIMVTYPSTYGVFDPEIGEICDVVHSTGGQVYLDGANVNAQVGLCRPGDYGADVTHLNLHKTFAIPHGGGGPGMGPICVRAHLAPFLPGNPLQPRLGQTEPVAATPFGSASILPISWAYIRLLGRRGLKEASEIAILNANYMMLKLQPHYKVEYRNEAGFCAHEFIITLSEFKRHGIQAVDIAKRLMDYGFHSPTMSWPVENALMIEPTESESKEECDRMIEALVRIRGEIEEIAQGRLPRDDNPLRNAPHTQHTVCSTSWPHAYSREQAAFPASYITPSNKFWPSCSRIDDKYGDTHLMCTCPPVSAYE